MLELKSFLMGIRETGLSCKESRFDNNIPLLGPEYQGTHSFVRVHLHITEELTISTIFQVRKGIS